MALTDIEPFREAAGRVGRRIGAATLVRWLNRSLGAAGVVALAAVLALRLFFDWRSHEVWVAVGLCGLCVLAGLLFSWFGRPSPLQALSEFDEKGKRNDEFSSAFAFLAKSSPLTAGEKLHVSAARRDLPAAMDQLRETMPVPGLGKAWLLPLLALVFSITPLFRKSLQPGDQLLSQQMMQSAATEAERIRKAARDLASLQSLSEEEKKELSKLESSVVAAAGELSTAEGQTARDMLASLESRARAAEKLAEKLGLAGAEWASEELLRELGQHVDTADLAIGIRERNADLVASQASALSGTLKDERLTREIADRIAIALERSMARATEADWGRPAGQRLGNASRLMAGRQPVEAAREFDALAAYFTRVKQRETAQEKLQKLAAQLRNSGSEISGSQLESLRQVGESQPPKELPGGLQPIQATPLAQQLQNLTAPQISSPDPASSGQDSAPGPGSAGDPLKPGGQSGPDEKMNSPLLAPVPGQEGKGSDGMAAAPGTPGGENGSFLSAPIPGSALGANLPGAGLGGSNQPAGPGSQSGSAGGNQAGSATMEMFAQEGQIVAAKKESQVNARINEAGDSQTRQVEGQSAKLEQAKVERREIMKQFIEVEEEALDGQTLPLSRRNQVLRYFGEIRKQLEKEPEPARGGK